MKNALSVAEAADARFWDRAARKYAASPIKDMAGYERTLARTRHYLRGTDTVLELGCGTGSTALRLAPSVQSIRATDISAAMIAIAREKAAAAGVSNIAFESAAAGALPSGPPCDAVLAFNLLHLVSARQSLLRQVFENLRPGGLFISKTACLSEMSRLIRFAVPVMQWTGFAPQVAFFTASELETEIAAAGFHIIETARHGSGRSDARIFIAARKPAGEASDEDPSE